MKKNISSWQNQYGTPAVIPQKIKYFILVAFTLLGANGYAQNKTIDELLDRPLITTVINGDTFLQRDLTDYLNVTLGIADDTFNDIESDVNRNLSVLKDYFMRPHPSVSTIKKYFSQASNEFDVPVSLLMIIGQIENNWTQTGPTIDKGWGIMHLVQNGYCNTLGEASQLIGVSEQVLKDNALQNIRGAAALLAKYAGIEKNKFNELEDWFPALAKFSGLISPELRDLQAINYLETLREGVRSKTVWGEEIAIDSKKYEINNNYKDKFIKNPTPSPTSTDYGPALTNLTPCNYSSGRIHSIDTWVNHWIGTGTYLGAISWFHNCTAEASAHFVIKNNGEITQVVLVANTAWHCGVTGQPYNNSRSIGVEHEATAANPGLWNSAAMLNASATMARYFKNQLGFPSSQNSSPGICGHNDMPGTSTQCPGPLPWATWMGYFNGGITPPSNDNCSNAITLNSSTSCSYTPGTVLNATASGFAKPTCDGYSSTPNMFDVWYKFTAVATSHIVTVVPSTSNGDPVVAIYSSCGGTQIGCSDVGLGVSEILTLTGLTVNNTYYIRIYDYGIAEPTGTDANFQICVTHTAVTSTITVTSPNGGENWQAGTQQTIEWTFVNVTGTVQIQPYLNGAPQTNIVSNAQNTGSYSWIIPTNYTPATTYKIGISAMGGTVSDFSNNNFAISSPTAALTVTPTSLTLDPSSGSNGQINVSSNVSWTASDDVSWLSVSPANGSNNGTITVTATSANTSTSSRSGTVTVSGSGITRYVTITQNGATAALTVNPPSLTLDPSSGSNGQINVSSNVSWTASDDVAWLSVSPTIGSNNGTITVTATSANTSTSSRSGTVTVSGSGITRYVPITQNGVTATPIITVSPSSLPTFGEVVVGQNSSPQNYSVSGSDLTANIIITAPTGFQISLSSGSGYTTNNLTLYQSGGNVPNTTIYARFSPTSAQSYSGNIIHTSSGATTRNVSVSGTGILQATVSLSLGWNIISVPLLVSAMNTQVLFPNYTSPTYGYSNGYQNESTLQNGKGYWLRYADASNVNIQGTAVGITTIQLIQGWNLISPYEIDIVVANTTTTPPGIITSPFYGYNNGYIAPTTLQIGKGYWVRSSQNGVINIPTLLAKPGDNTFSVGDINPQWGRMRVTDNQGRTGILYVAEENVNLSSFDLPPAPPTDIFDIRYSTNRYVEILDKPGKDLVINSDSYPVTIKVEGTTLNIKDKIIGKLLDISLKNEESYILQKDLGRLSVKLVEIPLTYSLYQNYPNPFNPSTTIKYSVPYKSFVTIRIYDLLGREIKTLLSEEKQAGTHEIEFEEGIMSSGTYFYRMQVGAFTATKKLILIK